MTIGVYSPHMVREYIGLSTDTKPTASSGNYPGPRTGDRFVEQDTGKVYVFNSGAWSVAILAGIFTAGA